jgi:hypothetical protein
LAHVVQLRGTAAKHSEPEGGGKDCGPYGWSGEIPPPLEIGHGWRGVAYILEVVINEGAQAYIVHQPAKGLNGSGSWIISTDFQGSRKLDDRLG